MTDEQVINLRGEGGVVWTFSLPLSEVLATQIAKGQLVPADEKSAALLADGIAEVAAVQPPPKVGAGSGRDAWFAYAEAQGYDVVKGMSRAEIIAAIEKGSLDG